MEIFCRDYRREVGYKIADSIFCLFGDGTVIQDISYSTKRGIRSLKKLKIREVSEE